MPLLRFILATRGTCKKDRQVWGPKGLGKNVRKENWEKGWNLVYGWKKFFLRGFMMKLYALFIWSKIWKIW